MRKFIDYMAEARTFAHYPEVGAATQTAKNYVALGLMGETGEACEKLKKMLREPERRAELNAALQLELGDVLWYIAAAAWELEAEWLPGGTFRNFANSDQLSGRWLLVSPFPTELGTVRPFLAVSRLMYEAAAFGKQIDAPRGECNYGMPLDTLGGIYVLWKHCCYALGFDPREIAAQNISKLKSRAERKVLDGDGDHR